MKQDISTDLATESHKKDSASSDKKIEIIESDKATESVESYEVNYDTDKPVNLLLSRRSGRELIRIQTITDRRILIIKKIRFPMNRRLPSKRKTFIWKLVNKRMNQTY